MDFDEFQLLLIDRLGVIQSVNYKYDLEYHAYLSFSGGKDSTILHHLLDMALPNNRIPRVFIDTGIEYNLIRDFVYNLAKSDDRFVIIKPNKPIKATLDKVGYPFKSKEHSLKLYQWKCGLRSPSLRKYFLSKHSFSCPSCLRYQINDDFDIHISHLCCNELKKKPVKKWSYENNRPIVLTGMRSSEGGQRANIKGCVLTDTSGNLLKFHPLLVVGDDWEDYFVNLYNIDLCSLYKPPFNFKRTGCKGCPFSLDLQEELTIMQLYLPNERAQCEFIWKPIYTEYRRLGYRLSKREQLRLI